MISLLIYFLLLLVLISTLPILVLVAQFFIAGFHGIVNHLAKCQPYLPNVAILIPAWNEADVLENTIDRLMKLDYPVSSLRIYIVDDGSTDHTPDIIDTKSILFPNRLFHIRREKGGLGKSHTLNTGLKVVLADTWAEAILIIDADIEFEYGALQKMTRHFADPTVGAVTCYIKVDLSESNFLNDCIASEYILSQAIARRAQNVTSALACLAGGAQLHTRKNIELLGGEINTTTLAEDTYTTFLTQLNHFRAIFEGDAIARAEEPNNLLAFWKQRFRWSRGNIQITQKFRHIWFKRNHSSHLNGLFFGLTWFSTLLMPFTMIITSISLILLLFIDPSRSWTLFRVFYFVSSASYIFSTLLSFAIDPNTMRKAWLSTLMFPGLISIIMMILSIFPNLFHSAALDEITTRSFTYADGILLLMDSWVAGCMFFAWLLYRLARLGVSNKIIDFLIAIVGYGPLLCTITLLAFIAEYRQSSLTWNKTEKVIAYQKRDEMSYQPVTFEESIARDRQSELRFMRDEILIIIFMIIFYIVIT
jgi:cellulose synthase/poly-beta-1,6-N-acetylglucosamine synthase-like glycosyltransferase